MKLASGFANSCFMIAGKKTVTRTTANASYLGLGAVNQRLFMNLVKKNQVVRPFDFSQMASRRSFSDAAIVQQNQSSEADLASVNARLGVDTEFS